MTSIIAHLAANTSADNHTLMALSVIVTFLLLSLLVERELFGLGQDPRSKTWAQVLMIAIVPLLILFSLNIATRIVAIVSTT